MVTGQGNFWLVDMRWMALASAEKSKEFFIKMKITGLKVEVKCRSQGQRSGQGQVIRSQVMVTGQGNFWLVDMRWMALASAEKSKEESLPVLDVYLCVYNQGIMRITVQMWVVNQLVIK